MTTSATSDPWICTTCRAEIRHRPTFHVGLAFCCAGCVADGPCICSYDDEAEDLVAATAVVAIDTSPEPVAAEPAPVRELVAVELT